MAKKLDALDTHHLSGHFLLALANARDLRAGSGRVARAFVTRGRDDEIDDGAVAGHQQNRPRAVELDVVRVRDDAQGPLDAFILGPAEQLHLRASSRSSCARAIAFGVTPPLIIRASSRARSSSERSSRTETTLRPSDPGAFSTSRWWSAKHAICARC